MQDAICPERRVPRYMGGPLKKVCSGSQPEQEKDYRENTSRYLGHRGHNSTFLPTFQRDQYTTGIADLNETDGERRYVWASYTKREAVDTYQ